MNRRPQVTTSRSFPYLYILHLSLSPISPITLCLSTANANLPLTLCSHILTLHLNSYPPPLSVNDSTHRILISLPFPTEFSKPVSLSHVNSMKSLSGANSINSSRSPSPTRDLMTSQSRRSSMSGKNTAQLSQSQPLSQSQSQSQSSLPESRKSSAVSNLLPNQGRSYFST